MPLKATSSAFKMIQMNGRAKPDLRRKRVLLADRPGRDKLSQCYCFMVTDAGGVKVLLMERAGHANYEQISEYASPTGELGERIDLWVSQLTSSA